MCSFKFWESFEQFKSKTASGGTSNFISIKDWLPMERVANERIFQGELSLAKCILPFSKVVQRWLLGEVMANSIEQV